MFERFECSISFKFTHSKVFSTALCWDNVFHSLSKYREIHYHTEGQKNGVNKLFSCSVIFFVGLVESRESFESEPSTFCVMNIRKTPQAAMLSSFSTEVRPIGPFRFLGVRHSLKATSHSTIFDILMRPVREDQLHQRRFTREEGPQLPLFL